MAATRTPTKHSAPTVAQSALWDLFDGAAGATCGVAGTGFTAEASGTVGAALAITLFNALRNASALWNRTSGSRLHGKQNQIV